MNQNYTPVRRVILVSIVLRENIYNFRISGIDKFGVGSDMDKNFRILNLDIRYDDIDLINKPWKPTLGYMIFGFLWILFSDKVLSWFVSDIQTYETFQMYKGWSFIAITSIALYYMIKVDHSKTFETTKLLARKNEELVTFSEELVAMEEDLEKKLVDLNTLTKDIKHQKDFINEIFDSSNMVIMVWKPNGKLINCNAYFNELLEFDVSPLGSNWVNMLNLNEDDLNLTNLAREIMRDGKVSDIETEVVTKSGNVVNMIWNMSYIIDPVTKEEVIASYGANITGERQKERRLLEVATTDALTNLKNRVAFESEISERIENKHQFTLYLIGLDNFKYLNDLYGHLYGDILLEKLGNVLVRAFEKCSIYRWNGDEFLLVDERSSVEDVDRMIRSIMGLVVNKWNIKDIEYSSSASVGIVRYPHNGLTLSNLASNLDIALNHAKRNGKGQHQFFSESFMESIRYEADMELALKHAISNDELELNYQPIYDMSTDQVVSLEALLRWPNNPLNENNIGKVISLAEKTGQIIMVDKWVLRHAFKAIRDNPDALGKLKISINISVQSFHAKNFIKFIEEQIEAYRIDPCNIELEITEYSIVEDLNKSAEIINAIKRLGVKIALDDFGTKYSSLNYLSKLSFDVLKIDKSYIDHILTDYKDQAIVNHLIKLSNDLNLVTIVEGIESAEQSRVLMRMGCQFGQGYYYSKPYPIDVVLDKIMGISGKQIS